MITYWLDFWYAYGVAQYMQRIDATTFMSWREPGIVGVPNIAGC